jgi:hypothetical protein
MADVVLPSFEDLKFYEWLCKWDINQARGIAYPNYNFGQRAPDILNAPDTSGNYTEGEILVSPTFEPDAVYFTINENFILGSDAHVSIRENTWDAAKLIHISVPDDNYGSKCSSYYRLSQDNSFHKIRNCSPNAFTYPYKHSWDHVGSSRSSCDKQNPSRDPNIHNEIQNIEFKLLKVFTAFVTHCDQYIQNQSTRLNDYSQTFRDEFNGYYQGLVANQPGFGGTKLCHNTIKGEQCDRGCRFIHPCEYGTECRYQDRGCSYYHIPYMKPYNHPDTYAQPNVHVENARLSDLAEGDYIQERDAALINWISDWDCGILEQMIDSNRQTAMNKLSGHNEVLQQFQSDNGEILEMVNELNNMHTGIHQLNEQITGNLNENNAAAALDMIQELTHEADRYLTLRIDIDISIRRLLLPLEDDNEVRLRKRKQDFDEGEHDEGEHDEGEHDEGEDDGDGRAKKRSKPGEELMGGDYEYKYRKYKSKYIQLLNSMRN